MANESQRFDLFLSYHWRDHAPVEALAHQLEARGLSVFLDRWHLFPGQPWPQALEARIASARAVAVMVGADGLGPWQQREAYLALNRQARESTFPVIPVLVGQADPPLGFLSLNTWVDLRRGLDDTTALDVLAAAARGEARVLRGGSWSLVPQSGSCALRLSQQESSPQLGSSTSGFGC